MGSRLRRNSAGRSAMQEFRARRLARIYASAEVFCFPSTTDTFGQVILEAGASGLPTLAVAAGGAAELVGHGQTGLLVPPDDPRALRSGSRPPLSATPLSGRASARALSGVAGRRTWERSFAELRDAYRIAVHGTPSELRDPDRSLRSRDCAAYVRAVPSRLGSPSFDLPHGRARRLGSPRAAVVPRHARLPRGLQHLAQGELGRRTGPFTLGGHSFGAALAVLAAARGEAEVERLVLVDPARPSALEADAPLPSRFRPPACDRCVPDGAGGAERRLGSRSAACGAPARSCGLRARPPGRARRAPRAWAADDGARRRHPTRSLRLRTAAPSRLSQAPSTRSSTSPAGTSGSSSPRRSSAAGSPSSDI